MARPKTQIAKGAVAACLAVTILLALAAGASAHGEKPGAWVEAIEVTETSATIVLRFHPVALETNWAIRAETECAKEPERCDAESPVFFESEGMVTKIGAYEMVTETLSLSELHPAKRYSFSALLTEPGARRFARIESFETPGVLGSEEKAHEARIVKEREKRARATGRSKHEWEGLEKKLAHEKRNSERF